MRAYQSLLIPLLGFAFTTSISAQQEKPDSKVSKQVDKGQESIGELRVSLIYGTNGDISRAGNSLTKLNADQLEGLSKLSKIKFKSYKSLGADVQPILRSYENWARPLKGSKEVLVCFQPRGEANEGALILDVEFWQSNKKILKGGIRLERAKPLYIQGPEWRGGKVIAMVELVSLKAGK